MGGGAEIWEIFGFASLLKGFCECLRGGGDPTPPPPPKKKSRTPWEAVGCFSPGSADVAWKK